MDKRVCELAQGTKQDGEWKNHNKRHVQWRPGLTNGLSQKGLVPNSRIAILWRWDRHHYSLVGDEIQWEMARCGVEANLSGVRRVVDCLLQFKFDCKFIFHLPDKRGN